MQPVDPNAPPPYYPPTPNYPPPEPYAPPPAAPPRFLSGAEIAGIVALVVPFAVHVSSGSIETENGRVVHWSYSNPIEIVAGVVAIVCALLAIGAIRKSAGARRAWHALAVLALAGLGVARVLDGTGTIGGPSIAAAAPPSLDVGQRDIDRITAAQVERAPPDAAPAIDPALDAAARKVLEQWRAGDLDTLYANALPEFRAGATITATRKLSAMTLRGAGRPLGVDSVVVGAAPKDPRFRAVIASVRHEKGTVTYTLAFDAHGVLAALGVTIPGELAPPRTAEEARRVARTAADALLAVNLDDLFAVTEAGTIDNLGDKLPARLHALVDPLGKVLSVDEAEPRPCGDRQCVHFAIKGTAGRAHLDLELEYDFDWEVAKIDLEPE